MPKILIREIDATTSGNGVANNFSVVVPGVAKYSASSSKYPKYVQKEEDGYYYFKKSEEDGGVKVFDENKIYECSNLADFESYVGKIAAKGKDIGVVHAKANESKAIAAGGTPEADVIYCTRKQDSSIDTNKKGYLVDESGNVYTIVKLQSGVAIPEEDTNTYYPMVELGEDAHSITSYGNQIAYLLISMGYTVLYKLIDSPDELEDATTFNALLDKSIYDFRYITNGICSYNDAANNIIASVAAKRADCVALLDVDESKYIGSNRATAIENLKQIGLGGADAQYSAFFAPVVYYSGIKDTDFGENDKLPGYFHYLACARKAAAQYPEWFAVSGYTRGVANMTIRGVGYKFGDAAVQALQPRSAIAGGGVAINLIINLKGAYYLWGNRTAFGLSDGLVASHFLNIRQLCSTLKKQIYGTCRKLTFDPNSDSLWLNFCNAIRPTLELMKAQQGIKDYRFEQLPTDMKAKLFAAIRIVPIEAVEDFEIAIRLEDNLDDPTIIINEELIEYGRE